MNVGSSTGKVPFSLTLKNRANAIAPGILLALIAAASAWWIARLSGMPAMLLALLFGLLMHPFFRAERYSIGLDVAAKPVLRIGVSLLGAGVVASEITGLGLPVLVLCVAGVGFTIAVGLITARLLGAGVKSGLLFGGSVAICGASAALAIAAAMPRDRETDARTLLAVIGVTALSTVAMMIYPLIASHLALSDKIAGIFFGAAIHDVAQVVGAGYMISDVAGETATMVKLVRVACLVPVVALIAYVMNGQASESQPDEMTGKIPLVPMFLVGFIALAALASSGLVAPEIMRGIAYAGKGILVLAIAAFGCQTSLGTLWRIGSGPVILLAVPTIALAIFSLAILHGLPAVFS